MLPFLGPTSLVLKKRLLKALSSGFNACKFSFIFKRSNHLSNYFRFKDRVPRSLKSCLVYKFTCGNCNVTYIGKTFRHFLARVSEHGGKSARTGDPVIETSITAVREHQGTCRCEVGMKDFEILCSENNHYLLELKKVCSFKRKSLY